MQPVPLLLALHVDRQDEQVAGLDAGNQFGGLRCLADMLGYLRIEAAQNRDFLEKSDDLRG
ncbi:hypothetical protein D3C85_836180 [compost metagenome]